MDLIDRKMLKEAIQQGYLKGNISAFGLWHGFIGTITLVSPLLNRIIHWKHRNKYIELKFEDGSGITQAHEKLMIAAIERNLEDRGKNNVDLT